MILVIIFNKKEEGVKVDLQNMRKQSAKIDIKFY